MGWQSWRDVAGRRRRGAGRSRIGPDDRGGRLAGGLFHLIVAGSGRGTGTSVAGGCGGGVRGESGAGVLAVAEGGKAGLRLLGKGTAGVKLEQELVLFAGEGDVVQVILGDPAFGEKSADAQ